VQANLVSFLHFFDVFIGNTLHRLKFRLHGQGFASLDVSFLLKGLDGIGKLALFLFGMS
jgi:hypothetical protein